MVPVLDWTRGWLLGLGVEMLPFEQLFDFWEAFFRCAVFVPANYSFSVLFVVLRALPLPRFTTFCPTIDL